MSGNQSKSDRNNNEYKRSGRPNNPNSPRNYSGGGGRGGGGGGGPAVPPSSGSYSGKSYKKVVSNNAASQGVQTSRVAGSGVSTNANVNVNTGGGGRGAPAPNGAHAQTTLRGTPDTPITGATVKSTDAPVQKSTPGLPKAPQSNAVPPTSGSSGTTGPATPVKGSADASKTFPLQFGSISPGVVNGMQVPARTSSAPPNMDEQKRAQALFGSIKATSSPNPPVPKQHIPRKDIGSVDQHNAGEARPTPKEKKEVLPTPPPVAAHTQKATGPPMPSIPTQMPYHHSQLHIPFGSPNQQLQSQGMSNTALPVPLQMHMPVGNPPQIPPQVFISGIQHHQGIIHQSQGLAFSSSMGPPQLGNTGMGIGPQYQQPMANFGGARRTVKITHPDTHEELRLDKRADGFVNGGQSGSRPRPQGPSQSQVVPSFPQPHQMNYYPNPYNANSHYFQQPGSNPLTSTQTTPGSQGPRFHNQASKQVTVKPVVRSQGEKVVESSPAMVKSEIPKSQKTEDTSTFPQKDLETVAGISTPAVVKESPSLANNSGAEAAKKATLRSDSFKEEKKQPAEMVKSEMPKSQKTGEDTSTFPQKDLETVAGISTPAVVKESPSLANNSEAEAAKKATLRSGSFKEEQKQPAEMAPPISVDKIDGQASAVSNPSVEPHCSMGSEPQEIPKSSTLSSGINKDVLETSNKVVPSNAVDVSASGFDNKEVLSSTEVNNSGSKEQVKEPVDQSKDSTVTDVTAVQQKDSSENIDDKPSGLTSNADLDVLSEETSSLTLGSSQSDDKIDDQDVNQDNNKEPVTSAEEPHAVSVSVPETTPLTLEMEATSPVSPSASGNIKGTIAAKPKKKKKDILKNADARGTTSDLYNAYKRPEEKKETSSAEIIESNTSVNSSEKDILSDESRGPSKVEPDDWEDAADISAPKMVTGLKQDDNDGMTKKYSRDFLLKFLDQCTDLPEGFEITPDIAEAVISSVNMSPHPSPGRSGDRSARQLDRRPSNVGIDEKWMKGQVPPMVSPGWDARFDLGHLGRPNPGVLRTPRGQPPNQYLGGILTGPMPSPGPQGHPMQRNNSNSDRWQRGTGYHPGLMPSPHTPVMHKAERKYEVGKITDEEQAKQRQLKGILNKLTPQNFEKLFEQVKQVNIDNANTLSGVIGQIFDKALMEPTFVEMYANFCSRLAVELPDFSEDDQKITFKRLLLNKCQEEFERGEREQEEANRTEEEGEVKQTAEEREEKRVKARRRMLGNIRLIGELYKKKMLTERIMHECIKKLLGQYENPDEEDIEALCKLMSTIGEMIDHQKAKEHMDAYFDMMSRLSNNMVLSSRVRFMLKDSIDLRKNNWRQRRKVEGPKKIDEVHRDAAQERQAQSSRLARGPNPNPSLRRGQPMDFGPRGSNLSPSNPQMAAYRGIPQQVRGFGYQEERHPIENRMLRPMGDGSITLGPQGGLARGMSVRGQSSMQHNGFGSIPDRAASYGPHDDLASRYMPERSTLRPAYPSSFQEQTMNYVNRDTRHTGRVFDQVRPVSPPEQAWVSPPQSGSSDTVLSEDRLHDKSIEAIKEFYSARDEKEVALCMKDLNAPNFYPSMISIWVTDSFERKDGDRDSLAKLLINLTRSQDRILTQDALVRGFESVLSTLEDSMNDAPKAAVFLGQLFARVLIENVIPYKEVWRLIYEGGEEQGSLVETGIAAEVLGVILEIIKSEKGDPFLNEVLAGSNLRLENFRLPTMKKTWRLDKFIRS